MQLSFLYDAINILHMEVDAERGEKSFSSSFFLLRDTILFRPFSVSSENVVLFRSLSFSLGDIVLFRPISFSFKP